ncbi:MAG: hypothetical protein MUE78_07220 [Ilumatobacteraceae bacterium]|jgi:hypothetical protein|nr:hypothetical protein [Ilumatobacteraceae bacterium]
MRRVTWFVGGAVAGAAGVGYAKRAVRRTAAQLDPKQVVRSTTGQVRRRGGDLVEAIREGREAMRTREAELRARRDGRIDTLHAHVGPADQLLVDGEPVEVGRVIVLRDAR